MISLNLKHSISHLWYVYHGYNVPLDYEDAESLPKMQNASTSHHHHRYITTILSAGRRQCQNMMTPARLLLQSAQQRCRRGELVLRHITTAA